jgi:hypothetical protein
MRRMNIVILALASLATVLAQTPSTPRPLAIVIAAAPTRVEAGAEVDISVTLKNLTNRDMDLSANISNVTGVDPNYIYEVCDTRGNLVPKRRYSHPELATGHAVFRKLGPGESLTETEPIGRLFDMSSPGKYVIQVSRRVPEAGVVVKSNKITVSVVQVRR